MSFAVDNDVDLSQVSGVIPIANGGTAADLSATGGTSQVLKQTTSGGVVTVGQLAVADLSDANTVTQGHGATTAAAGAATLNQGSGVITSEGLTAATTYTLTLHNSKVNSTSTVIVNVTDSAGTAPILASVTCTAGIVTIVVTMAALTGTLVFAFAVFN